MTRVDVVVPTWNGEAHLAETLRSVLAQTHRDLRVVVCDDASSDRTVEVASGVASEDRRVEVVEAAARLGWIRNTNAALERVEADWFMILPHDDLIDPSYVERMLGLLEDAPTALCAFSDVAGFGSRVDRVAHAPWHGGPVDRVEAFLGGRPNGVAWRGVTSRSTLEAGLRMRDGVGPGLHADTVWVAELLLQGPVVRCPEALFHKRYSSSSVMADEWARLEGRDRWDALADHCLQLVAAFGQADLDPPELGRLLSVTLDRLVRLLGLDLAGGSEDRLASLRRCAGVMDTAWRGHGSARWIDSRLILAEAARDDLVRRGAQAVRMDPTNGSARTALAEALLEQGQPRRASVQAARAVRAQPWNPWAWLAFSRTSLVLGRLTRAKMAARRVSELLPHTEHGPIQLSRVLEAEGDVTGALREARTAADLQPGARDVRLRLDELSGRE